MKKTILALLSILVCTASIGMVSAKTAATTPATAAAIKNYKAGNYVQAYVDLKNIVKKDQSNGLAYYYLGMTSTQLGKREEAIENYKKASSLSPNGILGKYAKKGIKCIEIPDRCHEVDPDDVESDEDIFIKNRSRFTNEARSVDEKERIENLKREMNRGDEIAPGRFKEYKDFSSQAPTNDEIVQAIRTLQRAGIGNYDDIYNMTAGLNRGSGSEYELINALFTNGDTAVKELQPQLIKSLLSNQMTSSF